MKSILTILSLSVLSLSAMAADGPRTREEVRAEVRAALANGERFGYGQFSHDYLPQARSEKTRAEVQAELRAAIANGTGPRFGEAGTRLL